MNERSLVLSDDVACADSEYRSGKREDLKPAPPAWSYQIDTDGEGALALQQLPASPGALRRFGVSSWASARKADPATA